MHEYTGHELERRLVTDARRVFCGNAELVERMSDLRSDLVALWCPGTLLHAEPFDDASLTVFSFGMAHKVRSDHYRKLATLLEATGESYSLYLSTALHENEPLDDSFEHPE